MRLVDSKEKKDAKMTEYIVTYITHESSALAEKLGDALMSKRLVACYNVIPSVHTACFWPPLGNDWEKSDEVVLICKTHNSKFTEIEALVNKLHTYKVPCIIAFPISNISRSYEDWLRTELHLPNNVV